MSTALQNIQENIQSCMTRVRLACESVGRAASSVTVVAASKSHDSRAVHEAYSHGILNFGENYVQELLEKRAQLAQTIGNESLNWHFIGHLQSKKARDVAEFVTLVHSVDSIRLATELSKHARRYARNMDILIQVNTSGEHSKSGVGPDEVLSLCRECLAIPAITLRGLMCIPEALDDHYDNRHEFSLLRELRNDIRTSLSLESFNELSMGMSDDFEQAIQEGATIVRLGTSIFGAREYAESTT